MHAKFGKEKVESRKETYYKEENQRIGESEQESGDYLGPERSLRRHRFRLLQGPGGILLKKINAKNSYHYPTGHLEQELVILNKPGDKAKAQAREQAIDQIRERRANACEEGGIAPC